MQEQVYADPTTGYGVFARACAPRQALTVSQWADAERRLSSKGSAIPGAWVTDRNPPLRVSLSLGRVRDPARRDHGRGSIRSRGLWLRHRLGREWLALGRGSRARQV